MGITLEEARKEYGELYDFDRENEGDTIWWTGPVGSVGVILFSFDKKTVFNLFADFPHNLTKEQVRTFCKENPFWANFFKPRLDEYSPT